MKKLIVSILITILASTTQAAWRENERRINTTLKVSHYNSFASQYLETPTNVIVLKMGGVESLGIEPKNDRSIYFSIDYVDEYLSFISKYIEWQEKAIQNSDAFTEKIGDSKSQTAGIRIRFGFYSGNAKNHYLTISTCVYLLGTCTASDEPPQYYDLENSKKLAILLTQLKAGELKSEDVSEKYN